MLPDAAAVESVYLDPTTGILAGISSTTTTTTTNKFVMECGTIETATIAAISTAFTTTSPSTTFLDAPVSGGPMGAAGGTLAFMVGAPSSASFTYALHTYLTHMGTAASIFHCGAVGSGTAFKLINNYLSAITSLAASEALNIGVKAGLDPKLLTQAINAGGGQCWVTSCANPVPGVQEGVPSARGYEGGFRLELCKKVLGMGARLAESVGARTVLDGPTLRAFEEAAGDARYAGRDARVVYKWLSESERRE
ncbi:putative 3-hydroxyisobutyrate dehydrogenase, mitochondrial [Diplodia seriata]|nr:putative 3-hydroxyisobutyrate dehydrogenase, mitochondrial [Diplodia seriata]